MIFTHGGFLRSLSDSVEPLQGIVTDVEKCHNVLIGKCRL